MLGRTGRGKEIRKIEVFKPDITTYRLGYIYDSDWRKYIKQVIRVSRTSIVNYKNSVKILITEIESENLKRKSSYNFECLF